MMAGDDSKSALESWRAETVRAVVGMSVGHCIDSDDPKVYTGASYTFPARTRGTTTPL